MKITTVAHVPDALAQAWLQHLRDFDTAHPGCHFEVFANAPGMATRDMLAALDIDPPLPNMTVIRKP